MSTHHDRLGEMLGRLKLSGIRDQLDSLLDEAVRSDLDMRRKVSVSPRLRLIPLDGSLLRRRRFASPVAASSRATARQAD